MIFHAIEKVVAAGIEEIFINTNPGESSLQEYIGDGGHWGVKITYFEQTGGPQGIAHVVNEAKQFIGNDPFLFYLSDNILIGGIKEMIDAYHAHGYDCMLALSKVPDPERFGVPIFADDGSLVDVQEKPSNPPNNFAVIGAYIYGPKIFFEAFDRIEKSARGEYEISSIHSHFLQHGKQVGCKEITGWWQDTGKPENLLLANKMLLDAMGEKAFPNHGSVSDQAKIEGNVHIGNGSRIGPDVKITGPVIIGENSVVDQAVIGPYVTIGHGAEIKQVTIRNSIILENVYIDAAITLSESLIGKNVRIDGATKKDHASMILGDKTSIDL